MLKNVPQSGKINKNRIELSDNKRHLMSDAIAVFEELSTANSKSIGMITINAEQTLNSLSLDMVDLIQAKLSDWESNNSISCVFLQSAGEKAFCAGGDVRQLYDSIVEAEDGDNHYALGFFQREYTLNHHIPTHPLATFCRN